MTHIIDRINTQKNELEKSSRFHNIYEREAKLLDLVRSCSGRIYSTLGRNHGPYTAYISNKLEAYLFYSILVIYGVKFSVKSEVHHSEEKFEEPFKYNDYKRVRYLDHHTCVPAVFNLSKVKYQHSKEKIDAAYKTLKNLGIGFDKHTFYLIDNPELVPSDYIVQYDEQDTRSKSKPLRIKHLELFEDLNTCFIDYKLKIKFRKVVSPSARKVHGSEVILNEDKTGIVRKSDVVRKQVETQKMSKEAKFVLAALVISGFIMAIANS
jgi:hypothetical protein